MTSLWVSMRSVCLVVAVGLGAILSHGLVLHGRFNGMRRLQSRDRLFAVSSEEDTQQQAKGMPSVSEFSAYYKNVVKDGAEMRLDQIMAYTSVSKLLNNGTVMAEDLNNLWISAVGDASGLNEQEGYELICMINDLPDPEDEDFYDKEFAKLVGDEAGAKLPFFKFMNWGDVQDMMNEGVLSMEEVTEIWRGNAGDLNSSIDRTTFGKINVALDDAIETKELGEEDGSEVSSTVTTAAVSDDDDTVDISDVDVWSPEFDPTSVFDPESLEEITSFFAKAAGGVDKTMTFAGFQAWEDVQELLNEKTMTPVILQKTWEEACKGSETIDYETFLRLNVRMDLLMDELEASAATPAAVDQSDSSSSSSSSSSSRGSESGAVKEEDDAEQFYRSEFQQLSGGGALVRLDMLLEWKEVKELIDDGAVTQKQVERMFEGMPKEPMGIPANTFGISEDTFVAFNGMLDVVLDASGGEGGGTVNTPSVLVSEPARPMPSQSELKLGDLTTDEEEAANTGLSAGDLELMQTLDKADNMLNSGDFGDFDKLIDDLDDPRLAALRVKEPGAEDVKGGLGEVLGELVAMCKDQQRCGLNRPEEEDQARMRDLMQAVVEKAPVAASRNIDELRQAVNGKWRLLYTNSEMFSFYNGVTGFANVFPTTKFEDLAMQYISDGYISESRYFETLSSPLGEIPCTVFSNWELVKEMSFMTNANSVVLRNYCSKVTAGPMEYLAEENWKSLRTMAMNELIYVDDNIKIMRNTGALRIFFVYLRED